MTKVESLLSACDGLGDAPTRKRIAAVFHPSIINKLEGLYYARQRTTRGMKRRVQDALASAHLLSSLAPDHERAVLHTIYDQLAAEFGVTFECFASPVNCHFLRFCSVHEDVDRWFGSRGNFFTYNLENEGNVSCVAHPPFEESVVQRAVEHVEMWCRLFAAKDKSVSFILFVPAWTDRPWYHALQASPYRSILHATNYFIEHNPPDASSDHLYYEFLTGAQEVHGEMKCPAGQPSLVFVLQSPRGAQLWPVDRNLLLNVIGYWSVLSHRPRPYKGTNPRWPRAEEARPLPRGP